LFEDEALPIELLPYMEDFELMVRTCDGYLFFLAFKETFGEIYCAWLDASP
jgi:hypothetical protein